MLDLLTTSHILAFGRKIWNYGNSLISKEDPSSGESAYSKVCSEEKSFLSHDENTGINNLAKKFSADNSAATGALSFVRLQDSIVELHRGMKLEASWQRREAKNIGLPFLKQGREKNAAELERAADELVKAYSNKLERLAEMADGGRIDHDTALQIIEDMDIWSKAVDIHQMISGSKELPPNSPVALQTKAGLAALV